MTFLLIGGVLVVILLILLGSIYLDSNRPFFRLVQVNDKFAIQYRKAYVLWRTYTLQSGEPAIFYSQTEAEGFINTLVERRNSTKSIDKLGAKRTIIHNYSDKGSYMGKK